MFNLLSDWPEKCRKLLEAMFSCCFLLSLPDQVKLFYQKCNLIVTTERNRKTRVVKAFKEESHDKDTFDVVFDKI